MSVKLKSGQHNALQGEMWYFNTLDKCAETQTH